MVALMAMRGSGRIGKVTADDKTNFRTGCAPAVFPFPKRALCAKRMHPAMKRYLPILAALTLSTLAHAASGPLRVLFVSTGDEASGKRCHTLMRDLGRDAIWFDYVAKAADLTPEWLAKCDVVVLDAPSADFPALAG